MPAICPLLSIGRDDLTECLEKECEWYIPPAGLKTDGACAARAMAEAIPSLSKTLADRMDRIGVKV